MYRESERSRGRVQRELEGVEIAEEKGGKRLTVLLRDIEREGEKVKRSRSQVRSNPTYLGNFL